MSDSVVGQLNQSEQPFVDYKKGSHGAKTGYVKPTREAACGYEAGALLALAIRWLRRLFVRAALFTWITRFEAA